MSCTIRACFAGNNPSHSETNCSSASRASHSGGRPAPPDAARQVATMISGCRKVTRSWSMTGASTIRRCRGAAPGMSAGAQRLLILSAGAWVLIGWLLLG